MVFSEKFDFDHQEVTNFQKKMDFFFQFYLFHNFQFLEGLENTHLSANFSLLLHFSSENKLKNSKVKTLKIKSIN